MIVWGEGVKLIYAFLAADYEEQNQTSEHLGANYMESFELGLISSVV